MVEVFKTNVKAQSKARMIIDQIHLRFAGYKANFDLEDCDKILRVESTTQVVQSKALVGLLNDFGFQAEALPDEESSTDKTLLV